MSSKRDLFSRERELCMLFIKNRKKDRLPFDFSISNKSVDIIVRCRAQSDWNVEEGRKDLNRLWRNFNLSVIGYKTECVVLNYRNSFWNYVTEYFFPMIFFNIDNFHLKEFEKYDPEY